jgi:hypothetical protein
VRGYFSKKYTCTKNAEAKIIQERKPKVYRRNPQSKLNLGDKLKAETIIILTNQLKLVKPEVITYTHRHKAMRAIYNEYTYAEIRYPFEHILKAKEKRKELKE